MRNDVGGIGSGNTTFERRDVRVTRANATNGGPTIDGMSRAVGDNGGEDGTAGIAEAATGLVDGDDIVDDILRTLDTFRNPKEQGARLIRAPHQRIWHRDMLNAALVAIYGPQFRLRRAEILARHGWDDMRQELIFVTARGVGKTWSVAIFVAAMLICVPNMTIAVFAQGQDNANAVITLVTSFVMAHPRGRAMVERRAARWLRLRGRIGPGDRRSVRAYPNSATSARGFHTSMTIVDEMAFMSDDVFMETILPTMARENNALIGISTPQGEDNLMTWLVNLPDETRGPGGKFFKVTHVSPACEACIRAGPLEASECRHNANNDASWKSSAKMDRLKPLYKGDPHLHARENLGMVSDSVRRAFPEARIKAFGERRTAVGSGSAAAFDSIWVGADPSNGGPSELALTAIGYRGSNAIVLLLAAQQGLVGGAEEGYFLEEVFALLRTHPGCEHCPIIFIPEGNLRTQAARLSEYVGADDSITTMRETPNGHCGVIKDEGCTSSYQRRTELALTFGSISFSEKMMAVPPREESGAGLEPGGPGARELMIAKLLKQLGNFRWDATGGGKANARGEIAYHLTGKKGSRQNDDLCISFIMIDHWREIFWRSSSAHYEMTKRTIAKFGGGWGGESSSARGGGSMRRVVT